MKDLETRIQYQTTPASMEVVSCSPKGNKFLKNWITEDDEPTRGEDGKYFVILFEGQARELLIDAAKAGLQF
jgi:hypothetical protein